MPPSTANVCPDAGTGPTYDGVQPSSGASGAEPEVPSPLKPCGSTTRQSMKRSGTEAVSSPPIAVRERVCSTTTRVSLDRSTQSPSASRSSALTRALSPHTSSSRTGVRSSIAEAAARKPSTVASRGSLRPHAP